MKRMACALALATGTGAVLGTAVQQASADPIGAAATSGLQLTIVSPGSLTSDASSTLDVNFRGGSIRSVELFVDNSRVFKKSVKFSNTHGNFNLQINSTLLPEGDHEVMVVAVDADGSTATSSLRVHVSGPEIDGIAQFAYPRRNAMVQNVVPIELKLDPNIKTPYVAYLLDNDFLSIRNYAPYVYNWDTTKISDGPHTIGVEIYDSNTQQLLKKMSIPVIVKNVGGFTTIQPKIPTISSAPNGIGVAGILGEVVSEPVTRIADESTALARNGQPVNTFTLRGADPLGNTVFNNRNAMPVGIVPALQPDLSFTPAGHSGISSNAAAHVGRIASHMILPNLSEMIAEPKVAETNSIEEGRISRLQVKPTQVGNIAARPHTTQTSRPAMRPIMIAQYITPPIAYIRSHRSHGIRSFEVAFNSSRIAFDVQPRVEHGMPLAPFRAIFEHSGGSVQWFGKSQTVRAVSANRQIEFKIGENTARVNNHVIRLAYKPYVENGRAIVPLSFVRDAMNVKVTYDARNSYLSIEGKR